MLEKLEGGNKKLFCVKKFVNFLSEVFEAFEVRRYSRFFNVVIFFFIFTFSSCRAEPYLNFGNGNQLKIPNYKLNNYKNNGKYYLVIDDIDKKEISQLISLLKKKKEVVEDEKVKEYIDNFCNLLTDIQNGKFILDPQQPVDSILQKYNLYEIDSKRRNYFYYLLGLNFYDGNSKLEDYFKVLNNTQLKSYFHSLIQQKKDEIIAKTGLGNNEEDKEVFDKFVDLLVDRLYIVNLFLGPYETGYNEKFTEKSMYELMATPSLHDPLPAAGPLQLTSVGSRDAFEKFRSNLLELKSLYVEGNVPEDQKYYIFPDEAFYYTAYYVTWLETIMEDIANLINLFDPTKRNMFEKYFLGDTRFAIDNFYTLIALYHHIGDDFHTKFIVKGYLDYLINVLNGKKIPMKFDVFLVFEAFLKSNYSYLYNYLKNNGNYYENISFEKVRSYLSRFKSYLLVVKKKYSRVERKMEKSSQKFMSSKNIQNQNYSKKKFGNTYNTKGKGYVPTNPLKR